MLNKEEQKKFEEMVEEGIHIQDEAEKIAGQPDVTLKDLPKDSPTKEPQPPHTEYEEVNNPKHYDFFDITAINAIEKLLIWEEYMGFLKGNALKYRLRIGKKPNVSIVNDLKKAEWYEREYNRVIEENIPT